MTRGPELTEFQRGGVIYCWKAGVKQNVIAQVVECSEAVVSNIINRYKTTNETSVKPRSGAPKKINERSLRVIKRTIKCGARTLSAEQLHSQWIENGGKEVSINTFRKAIYSLGYHSRVMCRKPLISLTNQRKRLAWAKERQNWTIADWKKVLFSDESTFTVFKITGKQYVWRTPKEKYDAECIMPVVKHSQGQMVWGCFSWYGLGPLTAINGYVNASAYIKILQEYAIPAIEILYPNKDYFFQEDNAPCHTAKTTRKFIEEKQIRRLPWPASSPDLNPIEHLWDEVERRIRARKPAPSNLRQLNTYVQEAWKEIPAEIYCNLIESMPRRCKAVIETNGAPTKY